MEFLPHTAADRRVMLDRLGIDTVEELFRDIPGEVRFRGELNLPPAMSEPELRAHMERLAAADPRVSRGTCFLGGGAYDHFVPAVVGQLLARGEFYTAYTPYQAEISQGTLQAIYEFQTMICELTGMDVANASMYDGASALAEAALLAYGASRGRRRRVVVSAAVDPQYRRVLRTYCAGPGLEVVEVPWLEGATAVAALEAAVDAQTACVIIQQPNFLGVVEDPVPAARAAERAGALLVTAVDPISLGILTPPGAYGAHVVVGEGQPLGNPLNFGGPYLGFFAARQDLVRQMPGRIAGATRDEQGRRGFVLTLQTREQHIRRERATSNICSNQALNALAASIYLAHMGPAGLRDTAELCLQKAHYAARAIDGLDGFALAFPERPFFKEFTVRTRHNPEQVLRHLQEAGILAGPALGSMAAGLADAFLVAVTEKRTRAEIDRLVAALASVA